LAGEEIWKAENIRILKHLISPILSAIRFLKQAKRPQPTNHPNKKIPAMLAAALTERETLCHRPQTFLAITLSLFR